MNIEGFGDLPDGFSLADEPLRQFCLLEIKLSRASVSVIDASGPLLLSLKFAWFSK
jgi:hypothetical protein